MKRINLLKKISKMISSTSQDPEKVVHDRLLQASDDGSQSSHSEDEHDPPHRSKNSKRQSLKKHMKIITKLVLICFAVWALINTAIARSNKPVSCSCGGTTVAEAIRRGCKFTPLAIAWLPPHCLDIELADEFDRIGSGGKWEYWGILNGTTHLTREEVSMLADTQGAVFYTTTKWHIMHCM
jgi:hypothetical protein